MTRSRPETSGAYRRIGALDRLVNHRCERAQIIRFCVRPLRGQNVHRREAELNALPQFTTGIDGEDVHFIHVKSPHENALPLIITHGWPGWVIELLGVVGPLTDPAAAMMCERMSLAPYTLAPGAAPSRR